MSATRSATALLVTVLVGTVLVGCGGSTLTGRPRLASSGPTAFPAPPSVSASTPTSIATPTDVPTPSSSGPAPTCTTPAVTAVGAPFCFTRPADMADYSTRSTYAAGWTYRTLVAAGQHELIEILAQPVITDLDGLGAAQSRAFAVRYALRAGQGDVRTASTLTPTTVADAPAYAQHARYTNGVENDARYVLHGHTFLYASCQYLTKRVLVQRACASVLASLHLADR